MQMNPASIKPGQTMWQASRIGSDVLGRPWATPVTASVRIENCDPDRQVQQVSYLTYRQGLGYGMTTTDGAWFTKHEVEWDLYATQAEAEEVGRAAAAADPMGAAMAYNND